MSIRTLVRAMTARTAVLAAILIVPLGLAIIAGAAHPAHASGCGVAIQTATPNNTSGNSTSLGNPDSGAIVFVTPDYGSAGVYLNHPIGVWYNGSSWAVFNQDGAAMPQGATFHVLNTGAWTSSTVDIFVHTATTSNVAGDYTILNDPLANGNPNAIVTVTQNWNPGGVGGTFNKHAIGVWYTGSRWAVFNQDGAAMPVGAHFNVMVRPGPASDPYSNTYIHTSTAANVSGDSTFLASPTFRTSPTTGWPVAIFVTPNWNPGGVGGAYHNHNLGVWWTGSQWGIFNQDVTAMPIGHSFNVYWQTC